MTEIPAFTATGGAVLTVVWFAVSVIVGLFVGKVIRMGEAPADPVSDEQGAYARIYELRSFEKRTHNVVPRNTQRW